MFFPKKISMQTMNLPVRGLEEVAEKNQQSPTSVLRIWGIVNDRKGGVSQYGPYNKYHGEFAALNLITGEEARSSDLLIPGVAETVVNKLFESAAKEGGTAQIALEITVTYNPPRSANSTFTKFSYGVKPLVEFKGEDVLSIMAKQLPPPTGLTAPVPAPAPAKATSKK